MNDTRTGTRQGPGGVNDQLVFVDLEKSNMTGKPDNRKRNESQDICDPNVAQWDKPEDGLPPNKRIKSEDLSQILDKCYQLKYHVGPGSKELAEGLELIRNALLSGSACFGSTRMEVKTNWGKCLALMLDDIPDGIEALKILTKKLGTGGGML